jgi:predicted kinase
MNYSNYQGGSSVEPTESETNTNVSVESESRTIQVYGRELNQGTSVIIDPTTTLGEFRRLVAELAKLDVPPFILNCRVNISSYQDWRETHYPKLRQCVTSAHRDDDDESIPIMELLTSDTVVYSLSVSD